MAGTPIDDNELLKRITVNPQIFGGKPIIRGRRMAVEHIIGMIAAGEDEADILASADWLEPEDIRACLVYAHRLVSRERVDLPILRNPPSGEAA